MNETEFINDYNGKVINLSKMIFDWNLTNSNAKNELFYFAEKILKSLDKDENGNIIKRIIESELCGKYGLFKTDFDSQKLTEEILNWWNEN
ncbi:MAG: hypothetical protein L6264_00055 [Weeksellaceae bacterium]|nr:hypothetical protein [Bacteroidota bacterium]MCG2779314.1 hypothetical protein [Weeksellaceae bacterium]